MDISARTMREGCAYLSANFERGSQLSVFVGMFRLDFKPAILVGVEEKRISSGGVDGNQTRVWFVCGGREDH